MNRRQGTNPFATCYIRPGAIPYHYPAGISAAALVSRLEALECCAQIVGPHGSGKSSLVADLLLECARRGIQVRSFAVSDGNRRWSRSFVEGLWAWRRAPTVWSNARRFSLKESRGTADVRQLFVIDGYEQLGWWSRQWLHWLRLRHRFGLLVTAHRNAGLPTLFTTAISPELAQIVVDYLLRGEPSTRVASLNLPERLAFHQGNLRETLFDLYDWYEQADSPDQSC